VPVGKGIAGIVAATGQGLMVNDAVNDPRVFREADEKTSMTTRNLISVPLQVKGRIIGVLQAINKSSGGDFTAEDFSLLQSFSDFAALAINNRELYQEMQRQAQESYALYRLSESIHICESTDELLNRNIRIVSDIIEAGRVSITIRGRGAFKLIAGIGLPETKPDQEGFGYPIYRHIIDTGKGVFSANTKEDIRFKDISPGDEYPGDSFIAVPMKMKNEIVAFLSVSEHQRKLQYNAEDMQLLERLAQQITENYYHFRLSEEVREKQRMEAELSIASKIQQDIIPQIFYKKDRIEVSAINLPARTVGGDFYDFIPLSRNRFGIVIADVSGKGVSAGLFMAISHSILRLLFAKLKDPARVLEEANRFICSQSKSSMFVTCFCGVVNTARREIKYVNAGHGNQFLFNGARQGPLVLTTTSRPLGIIDQATFDSATVDYAPGDLLFLYTDGITDALDEKGHNYGEALLVDSVAKSLSRGCPEIVDELISDVLRFQGRSEQYDDLTVLAVKL